MDNVILVVHVLTALSIIGLILLQQGKGAEMGASFGAGASQTVFGSAGSGNFFSRLTGILAAVFFVTSFGLAIVAKQSGSVSVDSAIPAVVEMQKAAADSSDVPASDSDMPAIEEKSAGGEEIPTAE